MNQGAERVLAFIAFIGVTACAHDPVRVPEVPAAAQYTPTPVTEERLAPGKDIPAQWWTLFQSPALDGLVRQALEGSPSLVRANAKLRQAKEDLSARSGATQ